MLVWRVIVKESLRLRQCARKVSRVVPLTLMIPPKR
jgi:hypothetical protein